MCNAKEKEINNRALTRELTLLAEVDFSAPFLLAASSVFCPLDALCDTLDFPVVGLLEILPFACKKAISSLAIAAF
jgi:hypothetical protein